MDVPVATSATVTDAEIEKARRAGWKIVDYPGKSGLTRRVAVCDGAYGQVHYGILTDLSRPCTICKLMVAMREKNCVQNVYVEGRKTFEFVCARGHHYLVSSNKKVITKCPMCSIEDECKQRGRTIIFDSVCTYVCADSALRYHCTHCARDNYISQSKWNSLLAKDSPYKSIIDWCQNGGHFIRESKFCAIVDCINIFEQIFEVRFDDCDDMAAASKRVLSGIYFTGYNRKLKLAFIHTRDWCYDPNDIERKKWCLQFGIRCITVSGKSYESALALICKEISAAAIPTRFDSTIPPTPSGVDTAFYRAKHLLACMLLEGAKDFIPRLGESSEAGIEARMA